jgi:hypothetical protein
MVYTDGLLRLGKEADNTYKPDDDVSTTALSKLGVLEAIRKTSPDDSFDSRIMESSVKPLFSEMLGTLEYARPRHSTTMLEATVASLTYKEKTVG